MYLYIASELICIPVYFIISMYVCLFVCIKTITKISILIPF